jgi:hypothetical protein
MDFEVAPQALRRASADLVDLAGQVRGDLSATYHVGVADRGTNPDWDATEGTDTAVASADAALAAVAGRARDLGESLRSAASAYEQADEHAAGRLRW